MQVGVALWAFAGVAAAQAPAASVQSVVTPPDVALKDPIARDDVFWWRYSSFINQAYEPPSSFYWPVAPIQGRATPFLPAAGDGQAAVSREALEQTTKWAGDHNTRALIVVQDGRVLLERYWNGQTGDALTNLRAITRGMTPIMLGFSVADGKVRLDSPISLYIPEWKTDPRGQVTVRQLAENVSGLEASPAGPPVYGNKDLRLAYGGDVDAAALAFDMETTPGTRFAEAQENTQLLAMIMERAEGKPLAEQMSERLWKPMGGDGAALQLDRPGGVARVLCCMRTTPHDLVRLGVLLMQDGVWNGRQILPKGWVDAMATPSRRNPNFGLGLWLGDPFNPARRYDETKPTSIPQAEPFLAHDVRFLEGGGYRELYIVPSKKLVILRLGADAKGWDNAYLVNTVIRGMRP